MNNLIAHWRELDLSKPPYVHPKDIAFFERHRSRDLYHRSLDAMTFPEDQEANDKHFFHLSLLPAPYIGDLERADVFILMLNPGFQSDEYRVEASKEIKTALTDTLTQNLADEDYPFWYLNPRYNNHPGHGYWQRNLRNTGDYQQLSQRLAVLQMVPYHSAAFNADVLARELPSSLEAKKYVHEVIVPRAQAGQALLIIARQVRNWGFSEADAAENIIVYSRGENLGAKVSSGSRGGKAIINRILR